MTHIQVPLLRRYSGMNAATTPQISWNLRLGLRAGKKQNASGDPCTVEFLKRKRGHSVVNFQDCTCGFSGDVSITHRVNSNNIHI